MSGSVISPTLPRSTLDSVMSRTPSVTERRDRRRPPCSRPSARRYGAGLQIAIWKMARPSPDASLAQFSRPETAHRRDADSGRVSRTAFLQRAARRPRPPRRIASAERHWPGSALGAVGPRSIEGSILLAACLAPGIVIRNATGRALCDRELDLESPGRLLSAVNRGREAHHRASFGREGSAEAPGRILPATHRGLQGRARVLSRYESRWVSYRTRFIRHESRLASYRTRFIRHESRLASSQARLDRSESRLVRSWSHHARYPWRFEKVMHASERAPSALLQDGSDGLRAKAGPS